MSGWSEKVLDIDLNTHTYTVYPLDMQMARLFIGGRGLGARLLWYGWAADRSALT